MIFDDFRWGCWWMLLWQVDNQECGWLIGKRGNKIHKLRETWKQWMKYIILYNAHLHTFASFELVSVFQIRLVLQKAPSCSDTGVCHNLPTYFEIRRLCQFTASSQPIHGLFTHFKGTRVGLHPWSGCGSVQRMSKIRCGPLASTAPVL